MNQKNTTRYPNIICSISQNDRNRPDTVADKRKQNINLLFCDNYRVDEALAVSNANNMDWTNLSRLTITLLISTNFWLLLTKKTEIYASYFIKIFRSHTQKTKITPLLCNYQRHTKSLWTLNKGPFTLQRLNITVPAHVKGSLLFWRLFWCLKPIADCSLTFQGRICVSNHLWVKLRKISAIPKPEIFYPPS